MENEVLMQKEIEAQRKLPIEVKKVIKQKSFNNMITAITIMIYFLITNILFFCLPQEIFLAVVKIFAAVAAIITIGAFEIGYRKKNDSLFLNGFEFLIFSVILLYLPYIYIYKDAVAKTFLMLTSVFFAIYYIIKTIIVYIRLDIKHKNSLSDIKDILKPEVRSYIEEESQKTIKARKEAENKKMNIQKENNISAKTQKEINDEKVAQIERTLEKMRKFNERRNTTQKVSKSENAQAEKVTKKTTTKKKTTTASSSTSKKKKSSLLNADIEKKKSTTKKAVSSTKDASEKPKKKTTKPKNESKKE